MGTSGALLHHDQALFKEPGGGFTPWHCDQRYWPLQDDGEPTVSAWIPLQDVTMDMGPLEFAVGSHLWQRSEAHEMHISDDSERDVAAELQIRGACTACEPFRVGDVSFHHGWTLHRAPGNSSSTCREAHTIQYASDRMRWSEHAPDGATGLGGQRVRGAFLSENGVPRLWPPTAGGLPWRSSNKPAPAAAAASGGGMGGRRDDRGASL